MVFTCTGSITALLDNLSQVQRGGVLESILIEVSIYDICIIAPSLTLYRWLFSTDALLTGFETVTIAFQGEVEHGDNQGNKGLIGPGDVQWMTAGKGIIHEEYLSDKFGKVFSLLFVCKSSNRCKFTFYLDIPYNRQIRRSPGDVSAVGEPAVGL